MAHSISRNVDNKKSRLTTPSRLFIPFSLLRSLVHSFYVNYLSTFPHQIFTQSSINVAFYYKQIFLFCASFPNALSLSDVIDYFHKFDINIRITSKPVTKNELDI